MLTLILLLIHKTNAIEGSEDLSLDQYSVKSLFWFGFEAGGETTIKLKFTQSLKEYMILLLECSPTEYNALDKSDAQEKCGMDSSSGKYCNLAKEFTKNNERYHDTIDKYITYYYVLINCMSNTTDVTVSYELVNPGNEQLSSGVLELKYLMIGFIAVWIGLLLVWIGAWIYHRIKPNLIQAILIINCALWAGFSLVFYVFLDNFSVNGTPNLLLLLIAVLLIIIAEIFYFCVLEIVSAGQTILTPGIDKKSRLKLVVVVLLLLFSYCLYYAIGFLTLYVLSAVYIIIFFIFYYDLRKIINSIYTDMQRRIESGEDIVDSNSWHQLRMFRTILISFLLFSIGMSLLSSLYNYYKYMPWIGLGVHCYIIFINTLILSNYFRIKKTINFMSTSNTI